MAAPLKLGFLMDPIERILPDKDTTFVFMLEANARGHYVQYFTPADLWLDHDEPKAVMRSAVVRRAVPHYKLGAPRERKLRDLDAVFMRTDPPFTLDYMTQTHFLDLIEDDVFVTNRPNALRDANEKLFTLRFPKLTPPTIVTSESSKIKIFMAEIGGRIVVKPLYGCGGLGVFVATKGDRNVNVILETATRNGTERVIAQKYVPEVRDGDKRIILLDGELLGATARMPTGEENRANIHVGGECVKIKLSKRDMEIVKTVGPELKKRGLHFVGLDVLGDWLTEINVTSPTGVQHIDRLYGVNLEAKVIDFVEKKARATKARRGRPSRRK